MDTLEKESSMRSLENNLSKMRLEYAQFVENNEKTIEKYQNLMKQKAKETQQRVLKKKEEFLDLEDVWEGEPNKKKDADRNIGEFFEKIKEIKKQREFIMDLEDVSEGGYEGDTKSFHMENTKDEAKIGYNKKFEEIENMKIEEKKIAKPERNEVFDIKIEKPSTSANLNQKNANFDKKTEDNLKKPEISIAKPQNEAKISEPKREISKPAFDLKSEEKIYSYKSPLEPFKQFKEEEKPEYFSTFDEKKDDLILNKKTSNIAKTMNFSEKKEFDNKKPENSLNSEKVTEKTKTPEKKINEPSNNKLLSIPEKNKLMPLNKEDKQDQKPLWGFKDEKKSTDKETLNLNVFEKTPIPSQTNIPVQDEKKIESSIFEKDNKLLKINKNEKQDQKPFFKDEKKSNDKETLNLNAFVSKDEKKFENTQKKEEISDIFLKPASKNLGKLPGLPALKPIEKTIEIPKNIQIEKSDPPKKIEPQKIEPQKWSSKIEEPKKKDEKKTDLDEFDDLLGELDFMSGPPSKVDKKPTTFEKEKQIGLNESLKASEKKSPGLFSQDQNLKSAEKKSPGLFRKENDKKPSIDLSKDKTEEIEEDIDFGE